MFQQNILRYKKNVILRHGKAVRCATMAPQGSECAVTDRNREDEPVVIKKYANRRLYNTATASFVRLDDLHRMVKDGERFAVRDEKSGRDITASVLAQIIAEEETRGNSVLPHEYLRQVLKAYSEGGGPQLAAYLERSMEAFANHQHNVAEQMGKMLDPGTAFDRMADMSRRNLEEFQRSVAAFSGQPAADADEEEDTEPLERKIRDLEERIAELERTLQPDPPGGDG